MTVQILPISYIKFGGYANQHANSGGESETGEDGGGGLGVLRTGEENH